MKILIPNFKGNQTATFTIKGQYKKYTPDETPSFMCLNSLDGQLYSVFNLYSTEITISKVGHIGLKKVSNFSIVK